MSKMNTKIAANTKDKAGIPSKINRIACFVGFLFSVVLLVVLANSSYKCLMLHATGYTTEAIVVEKLRKSKVRIQFTDMAGKRRRRVSVCQFSATAILCPSNSRGGCKLRDL